MPEVIAAAPTSAWTYGGAILTFVFPMVLFLTVAIGLYVVYTKPSTVPGHREQAVARPIGWTPVARLPPGETGGQGRLAGPHYVFPARTGQVPTAGDGGVAGPEEPAAPPDSPGGAGPHSPEGAE
ncbi:MAG TPA: hypothetical protein VGM53_05475 [Streptosporangiaceae bacterium]